MRLHLIILAIFATLFFATFPAYADHSSDITSRSIVESYTQAYSNGDADAMGVLMHEDIQWLTAKDDKITITLQGKSDMVKELSDYFKGPTTISSSLGGWGENGDYVSVVETASWTTKTGKNQSQSSNVIYQIENGLVRRVWYFPEQKLP